MIEKFVLENYDCRQIASFWFATGNTPIYELKYKGKKFAFYKTYVGAPACVGTVEDTLSEIKTDKYIVFGAAGCLNKEIARGKVMIPTQAVRPYYFLSLCAGIGLCYCRKCGHCCRFYGGKRDSLCERENLDY